MNVTPVSNTNCKGWKIEEELPHNKSGGVEKRNLRPRPYRQSACFYETTGGYSCAPEKIPPCEAFYKDDCNSSPSKQFRALMGKN